MVGNVQDVMSAAVVVGGTGVQASEARPVQQEVAKPAQQQQQQQQQQEEFVKPGTMDEKSVSNMTDELNKLMEKTNSNLEFKYHKEVNMMSVAMVDKTSGEVIKELPPEEMVNNMIKSKIWIGAFLDKIA